MLWLWISFFILICIFLALDLGVFHKKDQQITVREAAIWTLVWVSVSLLFNVFVWFLYSNHWFGIGLDADGLVVRTGDRAALEFFTGYLIEKSLSFDNIFVIALVFSYFKVPAKFQHRILFWGILGALVFRGVIISVGAYLVSEFSWVFYFFGVVLIYGAVKMLAFDEENADPENGLVLRLARRFLPIKPGFDDGRFTTRVNGEFAFTTLALVLLVVETTDVVFAFDSIPAIFIITNDPFLVLTSNIFAILGLRSLYFVLAGMIDKFHYLNWALAMILIFVGIKMLLHGFLPISTGVSLGVIAFFLLLGIGASMRRNSKLEKS
jgi:tellurite resistance protein TerC